MGSALTLAGVGASLVAGGLDADASAEAILGQVVQRPTATLPATTTAPIFTITGGRIGIAALIGEVTTVIQTQACNLKVQANPTATGSSVDLCADLNISAKAVATLFGLTGAVADALLSGLAIVGQDRLLICQIGTIDLVTSATNTGSVKWTLRYVPIDVGARVVAA